MTQEQRNKKAEQLRIAAQIVETGCGWEARGVTLEWFAPLAWAPEEAINKGCEIRIKNGGAVRSVEIKPQPAWKLPDPPAGRKWHRDDWTQDMLPDGWRPLLLGEKAEQGDEIYPLAGNDDWKGKWQTDVSWWAAASESMFPTRTRRPLPESVIPIPEGWRELRDDEKDGSFIRGAKYLHQGEWKSLTSGSYAYKPQRIIVPVAKKRVPLGQDDVPPGTLVRAIGGDVARCGGFTMILAAVKEGHYSVAVSGMVKLFSWEFAMLKQEIKRPTDTEWQPCSKEAES